jgi:hypothetical protein
MPRPITDPEQLDFGRLRRAVGAVREFFGAAFPRASFSLRSLRVDAFGFLRRAPQRRLLLRAGL